MNTSVRLTELKIQNYLGYGNPELIKCGTKRLTLIGKNNSGKSASVSALDLIKKASKAVNFLESGSGPSIRIGWVNCDLATPDIFHEDTTWCEIEVGFEIDSDKYNIKHFLANLGYSPKDRVEIRFALEFQHNKARLKCFYADNLAIFVSGAATEYMHFRGNDSYRPIEGFAYNEFGSLPRRILSGILYFPSKRTIRSIQNDGSLDAIASGAAVLQWIQDATNADAKSSDGRLKQKSLTNFREEFAKFITAESVTLSVSRGADLNLTINGRFTPIESLGTGISECLLILLAARVARDSNSEIHTIILEEPELHLHPLMQRQLIQLILKDDPGFICTTHSASVLNEMIKAKSDVYHIAHSTDGRTIPKAVETTTEVMRALEDIGVSAADVLHAEKVLWEEGPNDVPVFREWIKKSPNFLDQTIAIVPLGGDSTGGKHYNFEALKTLNPKSLIILDSERKSADGKCGEKRIAAYEKCKALSIPIWLTERRCTENYYTVNAILEVYPGHGDAIIDPYEKIKHACFTKDKGYAVAAAMTWGDVEQTDLGKILSAFLRNEDLMAHCFANQ